MGLLFLRKVGTRRAPVGVSLVQAFHFFRHLLGEVIQLRRIIQHVEELPILVLFHQLPVPLANGPLVLGPTRDENIVIGPLLAFKERHEAQAIQIRCWLAVLSCRVFRFGHLEKGRHEVDQVRHAVTDLVRLDLRRPVR